MLCHIKTIVWIMSGLERVLSKSFIGLIYVIALPFLSPAVRI